jgi:hypothetical protein
MLKRSNCLTYKSVYDPTRPCFEQGISIQGIDRDGNQKYDENAAQAILIEDLDKAVLIAKQAYSKHEKIFQNSKVRHLDENQRNTFSNTEFELQIIDEKNSDDQYFSGMISEDYFSEQSLSEFGKDLKLTDAEDPFEFRLNMHYRISSVDITAAFENLGIIPDTFLFPDMMSSTTNHRESAFAESMENEEFTAKIVDFEETLFL